MWNYRLVRLEGGEVALFEVYYTRNGVPFMRTEQPAFISGEDEGDARDCYSMMLESFKYPVLDDSVFSSDEAKRALDKLINE